MPNYRRTRVPGLIDGPTVLGGAPNALAIDPRYHPARIRITRLVSGTLTQGTLDFDAWLDSTTPFRTVTNSPATFDAWLDSVSPFTELV